jgi:TolA-binding protein
MSPSATNGLEPMMNCKLVEENDIIEKYVLGQLSASDQDVFERHYFECERCFQSLQTIRALQAELHASRFSIPRVPAKRRVVWRWAWAAGLAFAALVLGFVVWVRRPGQGTGTSQQAAINRQATQGRQMPPGQGEPPALSLQSSLQKPLPTLAELGQIQPPPYTPPTLRGAVDQAGETFREAMKAYAKGHYAAAIPGLIAAHQLDQGAANTEFFLGICYLETGQTKAGMQALQATVSLGETPYLEAAHFYLSKAYIVQGDIQAAQKELVETIGLHGDRETGAQELLHQLQVLDKNPR